MRFKTRSLTRDAGKRLKYGFLVFLSALMVVSPAFGLSPSDETEFSQNDILFYDPEDTGDSCVGGFSNVCGDTAVQKIYSGLLSVGFTPEQAVGALGNIKHEGNMNPAQWEMPYEPSFDYYNNRTDRLNGSGGGVGLIQWSFGRRVDLLNYVKTNAPNLMKYFEEWQTYSNGYSVNGDKFIELAGEQDANALFSLEIKYLKEEMDGNSDYRKVFDQTTVENATWMFLTQVERPAGITKNSTLAQAKAVKPERFTSAQELWGELHGFQCETSTSGGGGGASSDGSNVSIIGDSLTVRSESNLNELMPNVEINGEVGRSFTAGIDVATSMTLRDVVVFALGTNSSGVTSADVDRAVSTLGATKTIIFVTNYGTASSGLDFTNNNKQFKDAASKYSNVKVADWAASASADPDKYMDSDGYHQSIPEGSKMFADLLYNAVSGLGGIGDGCGPTGALAEYVLAYAWPEYHSAPYYEMMPDYADVVQKRRGEGRYVGGREHPGIDCGGWVTTLMQESGFEPEYNSGSEATGGQQTWVQNNGWTHLNPGGGDVDTSILQPGDVAFTPGHTFVYVGEIPGFDSVIASASIGSGNTYWRTPMAGTESLTGGVNWYRKGAL